MTHITNTKIDKGSLETDESLMLAYANGQAPAFDRLYERHKLAVYRFFMRQGTPQAIAEDLTHDTWLKVIDGRHRYTVSALFKTWLFIIARNVLIDYQKKKSTTMESTALADEAELPGNNVINDMSALTQHLAKAIAALPFEQRETFLLKQEAGFTLDEISVITQQNKEKVKSSWRYALQKLRRGLSHYVE